MTVNNTWMGPGGWQIEISSIIFTLSASNILKLNSDAELTHNIALCRSGNTVSRAVALSKKIPNHSQIHLNETNIFKFLLESLFWFTWQRSRISWTCGTGNKQCKFRQNIKWIGLENCRINNMRLKCLLRSTYSWMEQGEPQFWK